MLQVFDRVLVSRSTDTLVVLAVGAGIGLLMLMALDYVRARLQGVAGNIIADTLAPVVTKLTVTQRTRQGKPMGEALRDIGALRGAFSAHGLLAVFDAPWLLVYVALIWLAHPYLGLTAAAAAAVMLLLAVLNDVLTRRDIEALQKSASSATRYLEASFANAEVVQTLGMTDALLARWQLWNAEVTALQGPTARKNRVHGGLHAHAAPGGADRDALGRRLARDFRACLAGRHGRLHDPARTGARAGRAGRRQLEDPGGGACRLRPALGAAGHRREGGPAHGPATAARAAQRPPARVPRAGERPHAARGCVAAARCG
jgi:ABC-type multidrug transport system fused ATPase/permease subunit